ncbi:uncharacterized protein LOC143048778 [Mytilus galloprovincialis]|uniref:uncharacterized protein LOC143048778 n=1 Tax=Mytilus galloprovincialis TaxID=29158 RepID=UPI003F7B3B8E
MADSREGYGEGQAPMLCQICEIARGIEWKCLDCDLLMCQKCKEKIHPKFKLANEHKIVNIKDVGNKEIQVRSCEEEIHFGDIKCTDHSDQTCCMYCKSCNKLVCVQCVIKTHKSHVFEEISSGYSLKRENLRKHTLTMKKQEEILTNEIEKLEIIQKDNKIQYQGVNEKIITHEKAVNDEVEKFTKSVKDELDTKWDLIQVGTAREIDRVKERRMTIQERMKKAEDLMNIKDGNKFFKNIKDIEISLNESFQYTAQKKDVKEILPTFVPGNFIQDNFGLLKFKNGSSKDAENPCTKIDLKIGKEYLTTVDTVYRVAHCKDGHIWICSNIGTSGILQKVQPTGNKLKEISSYKIIVYDMAVSKWNGILLCTNDNQIQGIDERISRLRNCKLDFGVGYVIPSAICSREFLIVVGAINNDYPKHGKRVVIRMNEKGQNEHVMEYDTYGQPIFTYPLSVACTNDMQNVFVIDGLSHDTYSAFRLVILLGKDNIAYYKGHSTLNNSFYKKFCPIAIQAAPSNNILVLDISINALHILSPIGQLSAYVSLSDMGIQCSFSLCCTSTKLFIGCRSFQRNGCESNRESMDMAKLYELNIEGCSYLV